MANSAERILCSTFILLVLSSVTAATIRVGGFTEPKSIAQLVWGEDHVVFFRVYIESATAISTVPSSCQFQQNAKINQEIRGHAQDQIKICSEAPLMAGSEYLVALYPVSSISIATIDEIEQVSGADMSDRKSYFFLEPLRAYLVNIIRHRERGIQRFVVIPAPFLAGAEECIARTERTVVEFSDNPEEAKYSMLHLNWECFVREAMAGKPLEVD